jgi:hypothetical protein
MAAQYLALSAAHTQQLLISKYLYAQAVKALDASLPMSAGLAVSLCQDAAELVIWTIARDVDAPTREKASFDGMWEAIEKGRLNPAATKLPLRTLMNDVNKARVAFKHNGQLPTHSDAVRFLGYTDEFMREAVDAFYGVKLQDISMASLIQDPKVAGEIRAVEALLSEGNYKECVHQSAVTEPHARRLFQGSIPKIDFGFNRIPPELEHLAKHLTVQRDALNTLMLGVSFGEQLRFRMLIPAVSESVSGKVQFQLRSELWNYTYTEEDARFCVDYITDMALRAEAALMPARTTLLARQKHIESLRNTTIAMKTRDAGEP